VDFYFVLGVERHATTGDIKRAYRRLARRFHPDINPGDGEAAARFRQIADAYETLIDADRRRHYDTGPPSVSVEDVNTFGFVGFDFSRSAPDDRATTFGELFEEVFRRRSAGDQPSTAGRGADLHCRFTVTFDEAFRGAQRKVLLNRLDTCRGCAGAGVVRTSDSPCPACEGSGLVRSIRGHMVFSKNCAACRGAGRVSQSSCTGCRGLGIETRADEWTVAVPAGVADGARLRVPGQGHRGWRGGAPGDLYVDVQVEAHPLFRRENDDLHYVLPVAIHEAALGARIELTTPGGVVRVRVPPGTQSGQRFRLRERGMPSMRGGSPGDLIVELRLMLPALLDERSKELLREFGRLHGASVRHGEARWQVAADG